MVAMSAATDNAMSDKLAPGFKLSPCCDYDLLSHYVKQDIESFMWVKWYPMIISINLIMSGIYLFKN